MDKQQKFTLSHEYKLFFDQRQPSQSSNHKNNYLCLLDNPSCIFNFIPKDFIITTKNGCSRFNKAFLKETSVTISLYLEENQNESSYHLDIEDPTYVLGKFEQLYQGKKVLFENEDIPTCHKITKLLFITCCPNFMKPEALWCEENNRIQNNIKLHVQMKGLADFLRDNDFNTFTIRTNKNTYKCNLFCVYLSNVVRAKLEEDPNNKHFFYNFKDEFNEFQLMCDLFNLKSMKITRNEIDSLTEIVDDLQIECLSNDIDNLNRDIEKSTQKIDDNQTIADSIDELFDLLYNIKEKTVETVKNLILQSIWIETEENVQELIAFLLEVISTDILLHPYIFELINELNEKHDESNHLEILLPFITQKLIYCLKNDVNVCEQNLENNTKKKAKKKSNSNVVITTKTAKTQISNKNQYIYAFIYKFYKHGIIEKNTLIESLHNYNFANEYINLWFLPLFAEIDEKNINYILLSNAKNDNQYINDFILSYLPDEMDAYEKMLDNGEPDDWLIKALRNDDVDTVQRQISHVFSKSKKNEITIPFNVFDYYQFRKLNILNYAAVYGSLKCFKYLLLNDHHIDDETFDLAIYGGNIEIIKLADQSIKINKKEKQNDILYAIRKHKNDLFDWLIEKIPNESLLMDSIATESALHGNAHCLTAIIDKGFDITDDRYTNIIQRASKKGFFRFIKFFKEIIINKRNWTRKETKDKIDLNSVYFGNLSIFKLFINDIWSDSICKYNIIKHICFAVKNNYKSIVDYYLNEIIEDEYDISKSINKILKAAIHRNDNNSFHNLLQIVYPLDLSFNINFGYLLQKSIKHDNFEAIREITDIIQKENPFFDFSDGFNEGALLGSNEICQYFLDKKVKINFDSLVDKCKNYGLLNKNIYSIILNKINTKLKTKFLFSVRHAIKKKNYELVDYLFQKNAKCDDALYLAVNKNDIDLVNIVLKYQHDPDLINKVWDDGTALIKAVCNNNVEIVRRIFNVPGVNPSIYYSKDKKIQFPLTIALKKKKIEIINAILDFYGENLQNQNLQLTKAMEIIFSIYMSAKRNDCFMPIINHFLEIKNINPNNLYSSNTKIEIYDIDDDNEEEENSDNEDYMQLHIKKIIENKMTISDIHKKYLVKVGNIDEDEDNSLNYENKSANYEIKDVDYFVSDVITYLEMNYEKEKVDDVDDDDDDDSHMTTYKYKKNKSRIPKNVEELGSINSFLLCACARNDVNMVKKLLNLDQIDVNLYSLSNGDTPLITAIKNKNISIVKLLIDHPKININQRTFYNETALSIAVYNKLFAIANTLLINERFHPEDNQMSHIYSISNYNFKKTILSSKHIKLIDLDLSKILHEAIKKNDIDLIDIIIQNPFFDKNSISNNDIAFAIKNKSFTIFEKLIKLKDNDVNLHDANDESLLVNAVSVSNEKVIDYILSDEKFDSSKSNIVEAFVKTYSNPRVKKIHNLQKAMIKYKIINKYILLDLIESQTLDVIKLMIKLFEYDKKHDNLIDFNKLLPNGKSYFTSYTCYFNGLEQIFDFLLKNGIDPNMPDSNHLYPLEMAILDNSPELVKYFINTNKIDYSIKIPILKKYRFKKERELDEFEEEEEEEEEEEKEEEEEEEEKLEKDKLDSSKLEDVKYTTYLHLAIQSGNLDIVNEFLEKDLIDINITDDFGNTPLLDACIYKKYKCIDTLFKNINLDVNHCNNDGKDAITILTKMKKPIKNNDKYLKIIKEIISI